MLKPDQITALRDRARQVADPINEFLLADIARRISEAGQLTSTASYEVWRAQQLGMSRYEIKKQLKKLLKVSNSEIDRLLTQSAQVGYRFDLDRLPTARAIPFEANAAVQQIVFAAVKLAQDDFTNITQTLGMTDPLGRALPLQEAYRSCMDFAFKQVATGAADYNTAIRQATKNLAERGVLTIDYQSGVSTSLEAAVRRNIMGGLGLMQEQLQQETHDDLGCDGWEITAHANSAPDHEPIQGHQYSDAAYTSLNNSLVRRIGTLNCGHAAFPIILGVSAPQYTAEELQKFREDNEKGVTYGGRHYTGYAATQLQRRLESTMRKHKRRILVDKASGDAEKLQQDQIRLQVTRQEYTRFSKAAGLRTENERARVEGFGYEEAKRAAAAAKKNVEKAQNSDTMAKKTSNGEGIGVHTIGKIDVEKYKCVTPDIVTDEVVITDERIQHIKEHHPNDYERFVSYLPRIVADPDFIVADEHPNTGLLLWKALNGEKAEYFRLSLRLITSTDNPEYKNSVLTFWKTKRREYERLVRNKNILYKRE